jgi:hypothetical protein
MASFSPEVLPNAMGQKQASTAGMVVCTENVKTGPIDLSLAFFIRIWEGSMALKASWEVFSVERASTM